MNRKRKILAGALTAALLLSLSIPAFATSGDVAGAVEQTWTSAQGQIKTVVNNVVFPVLDVILAVLFFVKVGSSYFEYRKHAQVEFAGPAILFACLLFTLTALYPVHLGRGGNVTEMKTEFSSRRVLLRSSKNFYSAAQNRKTSRVLRKRMNCLSEFCLEV